MPRRFERVVGLFDARARGVECGRRSVNLLPALVGQLSCGKAFGQKALRALPLLRC